MRTLLHSVFDQPDAESVGAQYDRIIDALADKLPKVAEHLEEARADMLAFTAFPRSGGRSGRTTRYLLTGPQGTRSGLRREVRALRWGRVDAAGYPGREGCRR